ncbi:methyltransferase [Kitasatospora sp. NPDC056651]|uniref:methyltransferase n=1 Tax=Kitasatospora sp. NPDC056651 TaxID=3345892 RepID=UPI0036C78FEB
MTTDSTFERLRDYLVGPARFMNLLSCFELGLVDAIRDTPGATAAQLGATVGAAPDAVEQLLLLPIKEGFVSQDEATGGYTLAALGDADPASLARILTLMHFVKVIVLRQVFHLTDSVRTGKVVALQQLYGHDGNLYSAVAEHKDLREAFSTLMDNVTAHIDPWFFDSIDIPAGSRVLDLAGNTGLGAILAYRSKEALGLHVTNFDLPEKEAATLENFRAHGVAEHCSFIGGDVFRAVPSGYQTVLIKHFLDMFDKDEVFEILTGVHGALEPGGQVAVLVPVYPEDVTDPGNVDIDFFPAFFLGCTMGQGGPQKISTYRRWLEECGFEVTMTRTQDRTSMPPGTFVVHGVLCARRIA